MAAAADVTHHRFNLAISKLTNGRIIVPITAYGKGAVDLRHICVAAENGDVNIFESGKYDGSPINRKIALEDGDRIAAGAYGGYGVNLIFLTAKGHIHRIEPPLTGSPKHVGRIDMVEEAGPVVAVAATTGQMPYVVGFASGRVALVNRGGDDGADHAMIGTCEVGVPISSLTIDYYGNFISARHADPADPAVSIVWSPGRYKPPVTIGRLWPGAGFVPAGKPTSQLPPAQSNSLSASVPAVSVSAVDPSSGTDTATAGDIVPDAQPPVEAPIAATETGASVPVPSALQASSAAASSEVKEEDDDDVAKAPARKVPAPKSVPAPAPTSIVSRVVNFGKSVLGLGRAPAHSGSEEKPESVGGPERAVARSSKLPQPSKHRDLEENLPTVVMEGGGGAIGGAGAVTSEAPAVAAADWAADADVRVTSITGDCTDLFITYSDGHGYYVKCFGHTDEPVVKCKPMQPAPSAVLAPHAINVTAIQPLAMLGSYICGTTEGRIGIFYAPEYERMRGDYRGSKPGPDGAVHEEVPAGSPRTFALAQRPLGEDQGAITSMVKLLGNASPAPWIFAFTTSKDNVGIAVIGDSVAGTAWAQLISNPYICD